MKELIRQIVETNPGIGEIKLSQIATKKYDKTNRPIKWDDYILSKMVKSKEIVEIVLLLPNCKEERVYFPARTMITGYNGRVIEFF